MKHTFLYTIALLITLLTVQTSSKTVDKSKIEELRDRFRRFEWGFDKVRKHELKDSYWLELKKIKEEADEYRNRNIYKEDKDLKDLVSRVETLETKKPDIVKEREIRSFISTIKMTANNTEIEDLEKQITTFKEENKPFNEQQKKKLKELSLVIKLMKKRHREKSMREKGGKDIDEMNDLVYPIKKMQTKSTEAKQSSSSSALYYIVPIVVFGLIIATVYVGHKKSKTKKNNS